MAAPDRDGVTQRVTVDDVADLATAPGRAAIGFGSDRGPVCLPVAFAGEGDEVRIGLDPSVLASGDLPDDGVVVVDDGRFWFELRAVVWRGSFEPVAPPQGAPSGGEELVWLRLDPRRTVAWDYGALREEPAS